MIHHHAHRPNKPTAAKKASKYSAGLVFCATALLVGCGGGSDFAEGYPQAVTGVSVANAIYQQQATFTINGSGLDSDFSVSSSSCKDGVVTLAASTSATQRTGTCTIVAGPVAVKVLDGSKNTLYSADNLATVPPLVTGVTVANALYQQQATFTINGYGFGSDLSVSSASCKDGVVTLAAATSTTQRTGTCTLSALGPMAVKVAAAGTELYNQPSVVTVPLPQVTFATSLGDYTVELRPDVAPITSNNMLTNVASKYYDGTVFHRVISGFMVQGGGFTQAGTVLTQKLPLPPSIKLEGTDVTKLSHTRGVLSMARTNEPNSATSQFFVMHQDTPSLNWASAASPGYAAFGKVVSGLDVIDKIAAVPTTTNAAQFANVPVTAVIINSARQTK